MIEITCHDLIGKKVRVKFNLGTNVFYLKISVSVLAWYKIKKTELC